MEKANNLQVAALIPKRGSITRLSPFGKLLFLAFLKLFLLGALLSTSYLSLSPDEAQYWTWSRALDWGYYSKPPGIALQIWASTHLLGNHALGVRAGALLLALLLTLALYRLARTTRLSPSASAWAAALFALSPLGFYLSLAATTDGGAILFLVLASTAVAKGMEQNASRKEWPRYYYEAALWILCGALFKWTALLFWPFVLLFAFALPGMRSLSLLWSILLSLLSLLPSLYWNYSHDWSTFHHVAGALGSHGNPLDFLAAQIALLSPLPFLFLLLSYRHFSAMSPSLRFSASFPAACLLYLLIACFRKVQPNWAAYLYPSGLVAAAWIAYPRWKKGLYLGSALSLLMVLAVLALPWLQQQKQGPLPYRINPLRQCLGGEALTPLLSKVGYDPETETLVSDKYQTTSLLSFYGPAQKRAYFFHLHRVRKNQFSYWPPLPTGANGWFVLCESCPASSLAWYETYYQERLRPYFDSLSFVGTYPLYSAYGLPVKYAILFHFFQYNGRAVTYDN